MKNEDDIHYFKDIGSFNLSLYSNPSDPSLGFMDNTTGSDMFDVLKKFLKNTEYLCGSTVIIAAKRYPNEVEFEDLIADLQTNHVFVYVLSSDTPSGGSNPSAMFNLATRTNGYCIFSMDGYLAHVYFNAHTLAFEPNQVAAQKFVVSGRGSQTVPFKVPGYPGGADYVDFKIIYQDHKVDGSLKSLNYTITNEFGDKTFHSGQNNAFTAFFDWCEVNNTVQYFLNIDYEYQVGRQEVLVVRMFFKRYVPDYWLPFNN